MGKEQSLEDLAVHPDQGNGSDVVYVSRLVNVFGEEMNVGEVLGSRSSPGTKTEIEQAA
jgi:hypothetical protein